MPDNIQKFLEQEVPLHGGLKSGPAFSAWRESCLRLGPAAPPMFLEALRTGPEFTHYCALIGLRQFGYEAWADGDDTKRTYRIRFPGETTWLTIDPLHKHPDRDEKYWQDLMR